MKINGDNMTEIKYHQAKNGVGEWMEVREISTINSAKRVDVENYEGFSVEPSRENVEAKIIGKMKYVDGMLDMED